MTTIGSTVAAYAPRLGEKLTHRFDQLVGPVILAVMPRVTFSRIGHCLILNRALYIIAMYTGVRAAINQVRSLFLPRTKTSVLDGETLQLDEFTCVRIRVNGRPSPGHLNMGQAAGMISVHLITPCISRLCYYLLRLTSHFGGGHLEIAFYEGDETIKLFAIRNIVRSNIDRLGCKKAFSKLKLSSVNEEILLLKKILQDLHRRGFKAMFTSPEESVALAVNELLLNPKKREKAIAALKRKYRRIAKQIVMNNDAMHANPGLACDLE